MNRTETRVMVVDDDPGIVRALEHRLSDAGYQVSSASNGADAILACASRPPDVMILDVTMPHMDGYKVCERVRESIDAPPMLIIFLTGTTHAGTTSHLEQLVNQAGGDYFLAKPHDSDVLLRLLEKIAEERETPAVA